MEGFAYFPAIVYRDERPDLIDSIKQRYLECIDVMRGEAPMTQSPALHTDPEFRPIADYLLVAAVDLLREQGYAVERYDFYLAGLWAQEVGSGSGTNVHVHKNSQLCGWMFLETPENGAYPMYHDTRMNKAMVELDFVSSNEVTNATNSIHFNNVQPGTVLFSNSWMQHQLVGGNAEAPTRSLHFIISHRDRPCSTC
jgi:hypothetical protein